MFDTADVYGERGGSETALGEVLGARRKDIVLASKFGMDMDDEGIKKGGSRRYIMEAVEASLKRLRTDWIDLYQIHRFDPLTPIEETLRTLDDLIRQGKVRYIGCSNFADLADGRRRLDGARSRRCRLRLGPGRIQPAGARRREGADPGREALRHGPPALFPAGERRADRQVPPQCAAAGGRALTKLPQRADQIFSETNWDKIEGLTAFAEARGKTLVELAFSWLAAQPVVSSVIAGATKPEQIAANVKAAEWALSAEELAEIDAITK